MLGHHISPSTHATLERGIPSVTREFERDACRIRVYLRGVCGVCVPRGTRVLCSDSIPVSLGENHEVREGSLGPLGVAALLLAAAPLPFFLRLFAGAVEVRISFFSNFLTLPFFFLSVPSVLTLRGVWFGERDGTSHTLVIIVFFFSLVRYTRLLQAPGEGNGVGVCSRGRLPRRQQSKERNKTLTLAGGGGGSN